jgi:hypothetical protein
LLLIDDRIILPSDNLDNPFNITSQSISVNHYCITNNELLAKPKIPIIINCYYPNQKLITPLDI